ncbi:succinate dehydrogenase assembly factor 3, mitochondrial-like [Paramacrobiotus metropolitanus]|uniref:succinate dehydrogenase assembly factor 3, mitochondrial-like n=1 Tax=Paramacrobiotus metropolitanus TaxID=2943436 RepID=UPI002445681E|nr:succinate dehydrogenase assembly factor 3, mitochondrial-like [Paramacrobiotus metropolitanus]
MLQNTIGNTRNMCTPLAQSSHRLNVRILYKSILRLHRGLPEGLRELGTKYVQDEFRLHKPITNDEQIRHFMLEWTDYAMTLSRQLSSAALVKGSKLGRDIPSEKLDAFNNEQIMQLYALKVELENATKASQEAAAPAVS